MKTNTNHTGVWVAQTWLTFIISVGATACGIIYLPADAWVKGYLGMGLAFSVASTLSLAKTTRDLYEAKIMIARVDEARVEQLLSEHHPLKSV